MREPDPWDNGEPNSTGCELGGDAVGAGQELSEAPLPLEFDGQIKPRLERRYHIKGLIGTGAKVVIFGLPGCGKSFLAYDMARHIARGIDWFARRTRQGRCVYLGAEGQGGLRLRHAAWNQKHPSDQPDPFALIPTAVDLLNSDTDLKKVQATLDCFVSRFGGLDFLIIDTLAATFGGGDENSSDMAAYVANVERLCAKYGCTSLIVTHSPLDVTAKRPRGHSSLWGAADTVLHVSGDRDAIARRIHCLKQKDGDPGDDLLFTLTQVEIGEDEDGDAVTSCVVEQSKLEPVAVVGRTRLSPKQQIVRQALDLALKKHGESPPNDIPDESLARVPICQVVRMSEWKAIALEMLASPDIQPDTARKTFERGRERMQAAKIIGVYGEWTWFNL